MISVYVNKYNPIPNSAWSDGDTETLLFSIPNSDGDIRLFLTASVDSDVTGAGSFEFSLDPKSIWYNIWRHMKTLVRVVYDGETIFYGRVLTIDRDMFRTKTIHCEGAMTFFKDSVFLGKKGGTAMTLNAYLATLINAHNNCMAGIPEKQIFLGEVPGPDDGTPGYGTYSSAVSENQRIKNDTQKYGTDEGYKEVRECLEGLVSDYGGYMRVRSNDDDGKMYLDWMKLYFRNTVNTQGLEVATNVLQLQDTVEVNNIFTHIIPVGKNNKYIDGNSGGGTGTGSGLNSTLHTVTIKNLTGEEFGHPEAYPTQAVAGTKIMLKANPVSSDNSKFLTWQIKSGGVTFGKLGGLTVSGMEDTSFIMGNADVEIEARYEPGGIDLDAEAIYMSVGGTGCGEVSASKRQAREDDTVTIYANPWTEYGGTFTKWEVTEGGVTLDDDEAQITTFKMGTQEVHITGNFSGGDPHTVTRTLSGSKAATVSASESPSFKGRKVYIDAELFDEASFVGWSVTSGGVKITNAQVEHASFIMGESDVVIDAQISGGSTGQRVIVRAGGNEHGSVSAYPNPASSGQTVTITATPQPGSAFDSWQVQSGGVTLANQYSATTTFVMGSQQVVIDAIFDYT